VLTEILMFGIFAGLVLSIVAFNAYLTFKDFRKHRSNLSLDTVKEKDLCKQPHQWMKVLLLQTSIGQVNMCRVCGYIAGSKLMASQEMIDHLEFLEQKQNIENQLLSDFTKIEDHYIKRHFEKEIESGVDLNKLIDLHETGRSFDARFEAYLIQESSEEAKKKDM